MTNISILLQALRLPTNRSCGSNNVKSSHQVLARFHRLCRIHSAEHFFTALTIHRCKFAHKMIACSPFCVFPGANAKCEQCRNDPNGNVSRGNEKHKKRKPVCESL